MHIIVEGPDNSSKSTQIKKIKDYFSEVYAFHTLHYSNVKSKNPKMYSKVLYNDLFDMFEFGYKNCIHFICDRAHLGEMVYGPIYRKYNGEFVLQIEEKYKEKKFWDDVYLIMLIDTPENLISREDGLSFSVDPDTKQKEVDAFKEAFNNSHIKNKLLINIDGKDENLVFDYISKFLRPSQR